MGVCAGTCCERRPDPEFQSEPVPSTWSKPDEPAVCVFKSVFAPTAERLNLAIVEPLPLVYAADASRKVYSDYEVLKYRGINKESAACVLLQQCSRQEDEAKLSRENMVLPDFHILSFWGEDCLPKMLQMFSSPPAALKCQKTLDDLLDDLSLVCTDKFTLECNTHLKGTVVEKVFCSGRVTKVPFEEAEKKGEGSGYWRDPVSGEGYETVSLHYGYKIEIMEICVGKGAPMGAGVGLERILAILRCKPGPVDVFKSVLAPTAESLKLAMVEPLPLVYTADTSKKVYSDYEVFRHRGITKDSAASVLLQQCSRQEDQVKLSSEHMVLPDFHILGVSGMDCLAKMLQIFSAPPAALKCQKTLDDLLDDLSLVCTDKFSLERYTCFKHTIIEDVYASGRVTTVPFEVAEEKGEGSGYWRDPVSGDGFESVSLHYGPNKIEIMEICLTDCETCAIGCGLERMLKALNCSL